MKRLEDDILPGFKNIINQKTNQEHLKKKFIESVIKILEEVERVNEAMEQSERKRFATAFEKSKVLLEEILSQKV